MLSTNPTSVLVALVVLCCGPLPASAQSLNINFDGSAVLPSPDFGGAAGQPGIWEALEFSASTTHDLSTLDGSHTGATIRCESCEMTAPLDQPTDLGSYAELISQCIASTAEGTELVLEGLAPGHYTVYSYAWAGEEETSEGLRPLRTSVAIGNVAILLGGVWDGAVLDGRDFAVHHVDVADGDSVDIFVQSPDGCLNGIQLVYDGQSVLASSSADDEGVGCSVGRAMPLEALPLTCCIALFLLFRRRRFQV